MQRREGLGSDATAMQWPNQIPQLSLSQSGTPARIHQTSSDQLDDAESLLLSGMHGDNFEDIENLLGDDMLGPFEDCLRDQPLDNNLGTNGIVPVNGMMPTTSNFNGMQNSMLQNPSVNLLAPKLSRTGTRPSFDESNSTITNFMAKIPFRSASFARHEEKQAELDYSYNSELDMSFHLRKFDYFQLFNKRAKLSMKVKALAALLKYELEEDHDYYLLRNADVVIQICVDHKGMFTNSLISWFGSHLRVNERLKSLFQQNRWLSIMRHLKLMNALIPGCCPMNDRVNCLNGLITLEHDLTLLFKEASLATSIYGKSNIDVYRQRTDLTPFSIAIHWETLKPNLSVNEVPQFDLSQTNSLYVHLSVVYNEYPTLFPTTSCLNNNLEWAEMTAGINTPGKYCLNFSQPMIVRKAIMSELLELDASIYTIRPVNWISELASDKTAGQSLVFTRRECKSECHRYIFSDSMLNESDVYLVRRITFNSPKTIVGLLMLLRKQACFIGLVRNLFERFARRKQLPYTEHLVVKVESDGPTNLTLQFNNNRRNFGTVSIVTKNSGFEIEVCMANGQKIETEKLQNWSDLLNRTWSIPVLMHKIIVDLKQTSKEIHYTKTRKFNDTCTIANNGPQFKKFEYLQDKFIVKHLSKKQLDALKCDTKQTTDKNFLENKDPKEQLKKHMNFLRSGVKNSPFLSEYFSHVRKIYQIKKSTALKRIGLPSACLQTVMHSLSTNQPIRAIVSNRQDLSRVPRFIVECKTPTILPSMAQLAQSEQRHKLLKRRKLQVTKMTANFQPKRPSKKPNILKSSTPRAATEKSVRLDSVVQATDPSDNKNLSIPDPNAQPAKSILNHQPTQIDDKINTVNRLNIAQKILRRRTKRRTRFFGTLAGWRKFYKHVFRIESEPQHKTTFKQETSVEMDTLLSAQSENHIDPKLNPLPNPLSPEYFRRTNPQMSNFPANFNSFGLQNNYNLNPSFPNAMNGSNPIFNQPNLPMHLNRKRSIDGMKDMMDPVFDQSRMQMGAEHLMDLNASELAARRKERNINAGHSGMDAEEDAGFDESDESDECDPPPPHKISQQQKLNERRKRDQELRDQRQEKINKMVLEKQKQVQKQEEEFAQRHQLSIRTTRNPSNAGLTPGSSSNLDQHANSAIKSEEHYNEYENEQKPTIESLSIKLPRPTNETIGRKNSQSNDTSKEGRRSRKKLKRSSSVSSTGSNQSASSSTSSQQKKMKHVKKEPGTEHKSKKSTSTIRTAENTDRSSFRTKSKDAVRKISRGKDNSLKRPSSASSSSSGSSSSSSISSSSDSRPPTLTDRLQRQSSALTDIMQQDDESRQSTRSTSSIPHLQAANETNQSWQSKDGRNSRKTSTISASTVSGYYPFELEAGAKNEFDDPESPPFAQILASTSGKRQDDAKQKSSNKSSKDKNRQKHKSGDVQPVTENDKLKEKKLKTLESIKGCKSVDKIAERLKEKEKATLKLKIAEKDEKSKEKNKEGDKLKVKDKSAVPKNKPSPRLQALPDVFDVPTTDSKVFKRKRDTKEPIPPVKNRPKDQVVGKDGKPKDIRDASKERSDHKSGVKLPETNKDSKAKRPKEIKLLQEIPASPLPIQSQTRKRSPLPRRKDEPAKKTRLVDSEFKPSTSVDKTLRSSSAKNPKTEESRSGVKRTLSTTSDEKRRKVRKVEKSDEKLKEPETPTKKKPTNVNIFPDLPEFTGRPCLSNLKNFKIPKVVDTETTKKEVEEEKEKETSSQDKSKDVRETTSKETKPESSRAERWERDEKRDVYSAERREPYAESPYDRRTDGTTFFPSDSGQREHFYAGRGNPNHYARGGKYYNSHHGNYPAGSTYPATSHRNQGASYESSPVYNDRGNSFRRQRGGAVMKPGGSYDDYPANKTRPPVHFVVPPHHKKSLTETGESPSHQQPPRSGSAQRRNYGREKPWSANYYPEESGDGRDYPSLMPPTGPTSYIAFNAGAQFQSPSEDQYEGRDFRPPYHRFDTEDNGGDSPDGLQIDENA